MARTNTRTRAPRPLTHEGAPADRITKEQELRRSVSCCLLWENEFYESGEDIASRIRRLALECSPQFVSNLAIDVRNRLHLRHVPLWLLCALAKTGTGIPGLVGNTVAQTIQRPDEIPELLAQYYKANGVAIKDKGGKINKIKMPKQFKNGIARAFTKFNEYSLDKWNKDGDISLKYAMRGVHPKPKDEAQAQLWAKLLGKEDKETGKSQKLKTADTVMSALSAGKEKKTAEDKKTVFERQLREGKIGYFALLKNLRGMVDAGVDRQLVIDALRARKGDKGILPFRYVSAARAAPTYEPYVDEALQHAIKSSRELPGHTWVLVDVSGSMDASISAKSDLSRIDAAAALASLIHGDRTVITFSNEIKVVPSRHGMAGIEAILKSQIHSGTEMGRAIKYVNDRAKPQDRLIVITDEQSGDVVPDPVCQNAYVINVASYRNGVSYGHGWNHIDGWSEAVIDYIHEHEATLKL